MVNFPTSLDTLTNPLSTDQVATVSHASQHADANDILEALEAKVGADGSAVQTSHDYKLGEVTGADKAVGKSATQTLLNKTLTSPAISDPTITGAVVNAPLTRPRVTTSIDDANGNEVIKTPATASAVNEITVTNSATGQDVQVTTTGDDTNIGLKIKAKGTGTVKLGTAELQLPNTDGASGQVLQTDGLGVLSFATTLANIPFLASDGSDGDVTISSGTTTLTRDMYYNNLTVNGTGTLVTAGYRVFVKGTCTVDTSGGGGGINHRGGDGVNGQNRAGVQATGGTGGTITNSSVMSAFGTNGANGGDGGNGMNGVAGGAGTTTTFNLVNSNGSAGGSGGLSGGNGGAGGVGGTSSSASKATLRNIVSAVFPFEFTSATAIQRAVISAGAGGGGGGGNVGGGGGGGGATGGYLFLATRQLSITGTGAINANGGDGGNGGNANGSLADSGGGGGGGGGNGGCAIVIYFSKTGTGTVTANGGNGGTGGTGVGIGGDGIAGTNGTNGIVVEITA